MIITAQCKNKTITTFNLNESTLNDLGFGSSVFKSNFKLIYNMEIISITHYIPEIKTSPYESIKALIRKYEFPSKLTDNCNII